MLHAEIDLVDNSPRGIHISINNLRVAYVKNFNCSPADMQMLVDRLNGIPAVDPQQISKEAAAIVAVMKRLHLTGLQIAIVGDQPVVRIRREEETQWEAA